MDSRRLILAACGAAALLAGAGPARADAIDGNWCSPDGRQSMTIDGPRILTPGGARITGLYDRHAFAYQVPAPEPDAGAPVSMTLVNDNTLFLTVGNGPQQTWKRCSRTIS